MLGWFKKKKKQPADSPEEQESVLPESNVEKNDKSHAPEKVTVIAEEQDAPEESQDHSSAQTDLATAAEFASEEVVKPPPYDSKEVAEDTDQLSPLKEPAHSSPSVFKKLAERLSQTRKSFTHRIDELFLGKKEIDAELFDDLEEILVTADLGIATTQELLESARRQVKRDALSDPQTLKTILKEKIKFLITNHQHSADMVLPEKGPFVVMVVGVNGVGKTTTIGKITKKFQNAGQSVMLVAADTFRAAASSQLKIWGERNDVKVVAHHEGADPSSVVFDALAIAKNEKYDVVLVDTAGRLHTKANLMEELKKIKRVMHKQLEGAPHEILLVIDATTGQNGISQALLFNEAVGITGIALTKLDGTAKGGIVANITRELNTPIRFIGVGEQIDDLRDFDADEFIEALFES